MDKHVTLRDIAKVADLHFTTIGLALRNDPRINRATIARVQEIAQRLGYTQDAMLSALSTYRHRNSQRFAGTLGHIVTYDPAVTLKVNMGERTMLAAATAYAKSQGFSVELFQINAPGMTGPRLSKLLRARGIQGLMLSPRLPEPGPMPELEWEHFSVVANGYSITNLKVHRTCPHQAHNVLSSLRELRRRGYRRIGLIIPPHVNTRTQGNLLGAFLAEQRMQSPVHRVDPLIEPNTTKLSLRRWLRAERIDCVLLTDYPVKRLQWIRELGYATADDLGVAILNRPAGTEHIAGIDEQMDLLGEATASFVISLLRRNERGLPAYPRYSLVEGRWIDRPTVRPAPTGAATPL